MARVDRARLEAALLPDPVFAARMIVPTRFDDLDILGHVNNVSVVVILQEARVDFNRLTGSRPDTTGLRMMAAGLTVEFAGEMHHPEPVEVLTGVLAIGRTSFTLGQVIRQSGRTSAYSEATMVFADTNGPAQIPAMIRARLEDCLLPPLNIPR